MHRFIPENSIQRYSKEQCSICERGNYCDPGILQEFEIIKASKPEFDKGSKSEGACEEVKELNIGKQTITPLQTHKSTDTDCFLFNGKRKGSLGLRFKRSRDFCEHELNILRKNKILQSLPSSPLSKKRERAHKGQNKYCCLKNEMYYSNKIIKINTSLAEQRSGDTQEREVNTRDIMVMDVEQKMVGNLLKGIKVENEMKAEAQFYETREELLVARKIRKRRFGQNSEHAFLDPQISGEMSDGKSEEKHVESEVIPVLPKTSLIKFRSRKHPVCAICS